MKCKLKDNDIVPVMLNFVNSGVPVLLEEEIFIVTTSGIKDLCPAARTVWLTNLESGVLEEEDGTTKVIILNHYDLVFEKCNKML